MAKYERIIVHAQIDHKTGRFIQPDTRNWDDKKKAERERDEQHNRERFARIFFFADKYFGNQRTYDPQGRYNCGRCNQNEEKYCELIGSDFNVDREAGSCQAWEDLCAGDSELDFGPKGVATAEELRYGVAKNGVGFGCKRCPFLEKAYEKDSKERDQYCTAGNFRMDSDACCAVNGAPVKAEYEGNKPEESEEGSPKLLGSLKKHLAINY